MKSVIVGYSFQQSNCTDLVPTIPCMGNRSLYYILPPKQLCCIGSYYPLHMKSVIAVYPSTKVTAQIWRLLTPAYEVRYCSIFFQQSNYADLTATIPCMKIGYCNSKYYHQSNCADLAATILCKGCQSLQYILPPKQLRRFGCYYPLHEKLVIAAVNTNTKGTAQIWRLLSPA